VRVDWQRRHDRRRQGICSGQCAKGMGDANASPIAQLFMTVIVQTELGLRIFPAVYLWNQTPNISNFTPAWDVFKLGSVG
jgi:hypothetical protein